MKSRILAMVVVLLVGAACSDEPTGTAPDAPQPGTLVLNLTTPHADDGAVMFEVTGPDIDGASAANASLRLFTRQADGGLVGVVLGVVGGGPVAALQVPDVGAAANYRVRVLEVADRADALRASLTGYAITVTP
ncbi:MAG TPA: hypothetical protein VFH97_10725 [Gemmatimonadales bacterium]|nr:hypothetical protein [Gemmatimonadales bacterium]